MNLSRGNYFPYRYDHRLAPLWLPFRPWPGQQGVTLTDDRLIARYGPDGLVEALNDAIAC